MQETSKNPVHMMRLLKYPTEYSNTLELQLNLLSFSLDTLQLKWMKNPISTIFVFAKQKSKMFALLTIVAVIPPKVNAVRPHWFI